MRVQPFFDARTFTLSYVVFDEETRDAVAIDPVLDYEPIGSYTHTESIDQLSAFVNSEKLRLHFALETHAHADHLTGAQLLRRRFDARVVIGAAIKEVQATFKDVFSLSHLATDGAQAPLPERAGEHRRGAHAAAHERQALPRHAHQPLPPGGRAR
jgi:glyoxylase-like metal-dependent hydrolase (beta-lactamase superfamily II)